MNVGLKNNVFEKIYKLNGCSNYLDVRLTRIWL